MKLSKILILYCFAVLFVSLTLGEVNAETNTETTPETKKETTTETKTDATPETTTETKTETKTETTPETKKETTTETKTDATPETTTETKTETKTETTPETKKETTTETKTDATPETTTETKTETETKNDAETGTETKTETKTETETTPETNPEKKDDVKAEDNPCLPNQVHLSLGDAYYNTLYNDDQTKNPHQNNKNVSMYVVWQTKGICDDNVLYVTKDNTTPDDPANKIITSIDVWHQNLNETIPASYNKGLGEGRYVSSSHTASLYGLTGGDIYSYEIRQNGTTKAGPFKFKVPALSHSKSMKFSVYADIDTNRTNVTVNALNKIAEKEPLGLDMQLFLGDLGYQIFSENGLRGEYFYNTMQPSLGSTPFMMTPGNHEIFNDYKFLNFRNRMPLYNQTHNNFYSYSVGNAHFIAIDIYYWDDQKINQTRRDEMMKWVEDDLIMANKNRASRPWIFVYTHQPIYCSLNRPNDEERKRCYWFGNKNTVWSDLFDKYKVDMVLQAHVHYYERMGPVSKNTTQKYDTWNEKTKTSHIINPQAPIYTIEGSAGNSHFMIEDPSPPASYSIMIDTNFGYSTVKIVNDSAVYYEHINSETGAVIDYFYLYKGDEYRDPCQPDQAHLSLGDAYYNSLYDGDKAKHPYKDITNASMFIVWQTRARCENYVVVTSDDPTFKLEIQPGDMWHHDLDETIPAKFNKGLGDGRYVSVSHTASLFGLKDGAIYSYEIIQPNNRNRLGPFKFKVPALNSINSTNQTMKFSVYADIDTNRTNVTVNALNKIVEKNPFELDMQLFLGDLGYQIFGENGLRGEYFYNTMQPSLGSTPFMMTPGNHEIYRNYTFLNFRNRMPLYNQTYNNFYSYSVGNAHFISIDIYYWDNQNASKSRMDEILKWVEDDLIMANKTRASRPWIFVYTHQPIYCSLNRPNDEEYKRCYHFGNKNTVWSDLFDKYKVDMVLQAHVHYYERLQPTAKNASQKYDTWDEKTKINHIINPQAPVYTIEGSAGNSHFMIDDPSPPASYSVKIDLNFGYSTVKIVNNSALHYEHINSETGAVIDYFYLYKGDQYVVTRPGNSSIFSKPLFWLILGIVVGLLAWGATILYKRYSDKNRSESLMPLVNPKETEISVF